jgi:hypothetical protein
MSAVRLIAQLAVVLCAGIVAGAGVARAQTPPVTDAAKDLVGSWEISNSDRDKRCGITFSLDPAQGGFKLELEPECGIAQLKEVVAWAMGPNDVLRLLDPKAVAVLEFTEVESGMYEGERKGEGLYFMQTQAALKAEIRTAEQMFGDWRILRELDKPLCTITLSNASGGGETYKVVVKPGCDAAIAGAGFATWRLDRDQLVLAGRSTNWRFSESDPTTWERVPLSTDPMLLMKQ